MREYENNNYSSDISKWVSNHRNVEDMRTLFLNMDSALRYIHNHGYCVQSFALNDILVLEDRPDFVQFKFLVELSKDPIISKEMIKEDIFSSTIVQLSFYLNIPLDQMNIPFIKENFDEISQFIPATDIPYYRGVVQRGASVYFNDYAADKQRRDLADFEKQFGDSKDNGNKDNIINFNKRKINNDNEKINSVIYKQISGLRDTAFINYLLIPTFILFTLLLLGVIGWVASLF